MPFPSPSRLEAFLLPYAGAHGLPLRVWAVDAGGPNAPQGTMEAQIYGHGPRLVLLGAGEEGLAIVRQTRDGLEDLDGAFVPWEQVTRLERDPHLVRDVLRVETSGKPPMYVSVSNHVLLPANRHAAKALCDLARTPSALRHLPEDHEVPSDLEAHPA